MKELSKFILYALVGVLLCLNVYQCHRGKQSLSLGVYTDTLTVYDTIPYYKPVPRDSVVLRFITEKLPASEPKMPETVPNLQDSVQNFGKTVPEDSVTVQIPITQKRYETDTYRAYVSGYRPTLDSLFIAQPRQVVQIKQKPKRWSVGIQAGYGVTLTQTPQFAPYIGIGVSYSLFSF